MHCESTSHTYGCHWNLHIIIDVVGYNRGWSVLILNICFPVWFFYSHLPWPCHGFDFRRGCLSYGCIALKIKGQCLMETCTVVKAYTLQITGNYPFSEICWCSLEGLKEEILSSGLLSSTALNILGRCSKFAFARAFSAGMISACFVWHTFGKAYVGAAFCFLLAKASCCSAYPALWKNGPVRWALFQCYRSRRQFSPAGIENQIFICHQKMHHRFMRLVPAVRKPFYPIIH